VGSFFEGKDKFGFLIAIGLTAVSLFLTEVISNVALVTIFLPVVGGIAIGLGISPLLICIPVTLAASCAFMLPMSTPPNAIVFASGHLTVTQMAKAGFLINILAILLIAIFNETLVSWLFQTID
jgi:sodium-dependent dicarboxylate transporter 2/3/5